MRKKETIESVRRFSTPFGEAWLGEKNGALSVLRLGEPPADLPQRETELSEGTVRNIISVVLGKLGLRDRTQLAIWAVETGVRRRELP